jgi:hypothetical protein
VNTKFWLRKKLLSTINGALAKPDPDNVSVVGPRGIGKTALLREVVRMYADGNGSVLTACYVDLRHRRPDLQHAVYGPIADALAQSLKALGDDNELSLLAEEINPEAEGPRLFAKLRRMAIDHFKPTGRAVLLVLDGCDEVLRSTVAPRDTWDGLCNLADEAGLRFITGSRRRLGELCRDDDAGSSDFYLRFQHLLELAPLGVDEWAEVFTAWGAEPAKGARDACHEWTGGYPALVAALGQRLALPGPLSPAQIATEGGGLVTRRDDVLAALWDDLGVEAQADLSLIAGSRVAPADLGPKRMQALERYGLVRQAGGSVSIVAQAVEMFAMEHGAAAGDLHRLFGTREVFASNVGRVLAFRAAQVAVTDQPTREYVRRILADVEHPSFCLNQFRGLAGRALDLIYALEAPGARYPAAWVEQWRAEDNGAWPGAGFPKNNRGKQCQLLRDIVDDRRSAPLAARVSRRTAALVDQVKSYGDLGQHLDDSVDGSVAIAACFAALEMCDSLARDLK